MEDHDIKYHYRITHYRDDKIFRTEQTKFRGSDKQESVTGPQHALQRYMQIWSVKVGDVFEVEYIGSPLRFKVTLEKKARETK